MVLWRVPILFMLLASLASAPAAGADAQPTAGDAAVAKVDAKASTTQPTAPEEPKDIGEAVDTVQSVFKDFKKEHYRAGIAGIIALLVFAWRRFGSRFLLDKIPTKALPWVTAGVAFVAALPVALAAEPWSWKTFIFQGLITGAEAMAFWSLLLKFVLKTKPKPDADVPT